MRLWLLLCGDLAIRSGTAARLGPNHYNAATRELTFTTKYGEHLTLPTTKELDELIEQCDLKNPLPFIVQLYPKAHRSGAPMTASLYNVEAMRRRFQQLCKDCKITRRIVPHDLRRTAAVEMLRATNDLRAVQALLGHKSLDATFWYLDHHATPVPRATLELIKRPDWRREKTA